MIRLTPAFYAEPAVIQAWLEDLAAKGSFLSQCHGFYAWFEKAEPKKVRYRLEPVRADGDFPGTEERALYRSLGWDYVCCFGQGYHIWRCDDPKAPELDTDPQVQAAGYAYLERRVRRGNLVLLIFWAAVLATVVLLGATIEGYYSRMVQSWSPWYIDLPPVIAAVIALTVLTFGTWRRRRFLRTLRDGVPQSQRRPYKVSLFLSWLMLILVAAVILCQGAELLQPSSHPYLPISQLEEPVPYAAIPEGGEVRAIRWLNWRTREQWRILQGEDEDTVFSHYHDFYLPGSAEKMARQLAERYGAKAAEDPALDGLWIKRDGYIYLVLWKETRVLEMDFGPQWDEAAVRAAGTALLLR